MATIRELVIKFGFDVDNAPLTKLEKGLEDLKAGFLAVSAAAVAAAGTIFGIAKSTANAADAIRDTSIAVGVSYEMLQKLGYAAQLSGSSQEELADSLRFLAKSSFEAMDSGSETAKTFRKLGVSATDASGKLKSPDSILMSLSDSFKKMPSGVEKSALALQLFGRGGNKFIQTLDNGSAGLRALGDEAADLGIIMSDSAIEAGARFNDTYDSLFATITGIIKVIGSGLIPVVNEIMTDMRLWIKENKEIIKSKLQSFIQILTKYLKELWRVVTAVFLTFKAMVGVIDSVTKSIGGFTTVLKFLAGAIGLFALGRMALAIVDVAKGFYAIAKAAMVAWKSALLGPILIGAAVLAAFLVIEDFLAWIDGRPSTLGFLIANKDKIFASIAAFFEKVKNKISETLGISGDTFSKWALRIVGTIAGVTAYFVTKTVVAWAKGFATMAVSAARTSYAVIASSAAMAKSFLIATGSMIANLARLGFSFMVFAARAAASWLMAFWPVALAIAAIASLGVAMYQIVTYWDDISATFTALFNSFLQNVSNLWTEFSRYAKASFDNVIQLAIDSWESIKTAWNEAGVWFSGLWQSVIDMAVIAGDKIKAAIIDPIKNALTSIGTMIYDKFGAFAAKLGIDLSAPAPTPAPASVIPQVQSMFNSPFGGITPAATSQNMSMASTNNEITSTINVTVPPGSDANSIGEAVRRAASEEFNKILRPAARATQSAIEY